MNVPVGPKAPVGLIRVTVRKPATCPFDARPAKGSYRGLKSAPGSPQKGVTYVPWRISGSTMARMSGGAGWEVKVSATVNTQTNRPSKHSTPS